MVAYDNNKLNAVASISNLTEPGKWRREEGWGEGISDKLIEVKGVGITVTQRQRMQYGCVCRAVHPIHHRIMSVGRPSLGMTGIWFM